MVPACPPLVQLPRPAPILDLGCGPGNTANELAAGAYRSYVGIDVSDVALSKARRRSEESGRGQKNAFINADLLTYVPAGRFDVILLRESIYHVSVGQLAPLLERYSECLTKEGVFIVRVVVLGRHTSKAKLRVIERGFDVVEKAQHSGEGLTVVVFRPRTPPAVR